MGIDVRNSIFCYASTRVAKSPLQEFISRSHIFQLVDDDGLTRLAKVASEVTFRPGDVILREGDPGDAFYAILQGEVSVDAHDLAGEKKHIALLSSGTVFGEIAALTHEPRTANITALTAVRALRFEIVSVFAVLKDYPDVLAELNRLGVSRSEDLLEKML
jgi:CRP-like cAMP-binding protein